MSISKIEWTFDMLTNSIQSQTKLVVDWSSKLNEPEGTFIREYDTYSKPFRIWNDDKQRWHQTGYDNIDQIESAGGDIIWEIKK